MSHIVLGITGGIAAYKAANLIRLLTEANHTVKVIPTENALRFIGSATLEALSHNSVDPDLYTDIDSVKHIALAQEADLCIVAPATASFLARTASGIADDLLSNTILATTAPVLIAPAMHTEMWLNPATQANVATLQSRGLNILAPATGRLTGQDTGVGRLPEAEQIAEAALALLQPQDFAGKKFLVTAGGTQESIDPVRFIGNRSSGKQGIAVARAAAARGAQVRLIAANIPEFQSRNIEFVSVETAGQMAHYMQDLADFDYLVMAAAVADYRVASPSATKIKKANVGDRLTIELVANADLLANAVATKHSQNLKVVVVGFAAETAADDTEFRQLAAHKMMAKGCDVLVANDVSRTDVFGSDSNNVLVLAQSAIEKRFEGSKTEIANDILDILSNL